jgi:hypothetical protein
MPRKNLHEAEPSGNLAKPAAPPKPRPMHDSPDNPKVYGKPTVTPRDNLPLGTDVDTDTAPSQPSPYTGRT